jgi:hypothetical protein
MARSIVIAGSVAQKPRHGGHTWVFLQYLLGFRRLGWDVLFLDRLAPGESANLQYLADVMDRFGLVGCYAVDCGAGRYAGLSRAEVLERTAAAALLLNVMGFLADAEALARARRRVFLDIDPGFGQMWRELGLADPFRGHDTFVTIGENIGQPGCTVPTCGLDWITTPQPVVLEHWPVAADGGNAFTTVASWRGAYGPVEYRGEVYGLRVHEFRKFAELPRRTGRDFRLALDIHPADARDVGMLRSNGWVLDDPRVIAGDPWAYQAYIRGSRAEFMVAKNMYVRSGSGWFSDRSICYLASGRPVLTQDTGLAGLYPTGEGLLTFRTPEEAAAGAEAIAADYPRHARAARAIAEARFDSDKVLGRLLDRLGVA